MPRETKIHIKGLRKSFGAQAVLNGVDFSIYEGQSIVLIGETGVGKSLILKCLMGLIPISSGSIFVEGIDIANLYGRKRDHFINRCGMLFQQSALFDSLPVWQNITFRQLERKEMSVLKARETANKCLRLVGLDLTVANLLPADLSGGMQKRVGLARAISNKPEFILLDEPTAGLDPIMSNMIGSLIVKNVKVLGATALSVTSDINTAVKIADQIIFLHQGKVEWMGSPLSIQKSINPLVDRFIRKWKKERAAQPVF